MQPLSRYLVALDVGRITGFAHGPFSAVRAKCGSWPLPASDPVDPVGRRIAVLDNTLAAAFDLWRPSHVVLAERFPSRNLGEAAANFGLDGQVRAECWRRGIRLLVQPEGTVRKEMLGRGSGASEVMKALVMQWCGREGIEVPDHNAGDAAVLWRWARDELVRQRLPNRNLTCGVGRAAP